MTNLEWIRTLSEEEFADWLYDEWLHHLQYRWSSSRGGLIIWLKDRKTENSSEKPNNCEECKHWNDTEDDCADRHGCRATTEDWQDWKDKMWSEAVVTETTGKDINVRSKDEPQTERIKTPDYCDICNHKGCGNCIANNLDDYCVPSGYEPITQMKTQNSNLSFEKADERCKGCGHYKLTCDLFSEICKYEPKDEPQTERSE